MKNIVFTLILLLGLTLGLSESKAQEVHPVFIKNIVLSGFVVSDKRSLEKIIKANQNKRLTPEQIQQLIDDIKTVYLEAGFADLVNITYHIEKNKLLITILMSSR